MNTQENTMPEAVKQDVSVVLTEKLSAFGRYCQTNARGVRSLSFATVRSELRSCGYSGKELQAKTREAMYSNQAAMQGLTAAFHAAGAQNVRQVVGQRKDGRPYVTTTMEMPKVSLIDEKQALELDNERLRKLVNEHLLGKKTNAPRRAREKAAVDAMREVVETSTDAPVVELLNA